MHGGHHEHGFHAGTTLHSHDYEEAIESQEVDTTRLKCLNEKRPNSLKDILRPWDDRTNTSHLRLESDVDEQSLT